MEIMKKVFGEGLRSTRKQRRRDRVGPAVEPLDRRVMMAVTASFSAATGVLTVMGDAQDNSIAISRDAAGSLVVNGDAGVVAVQGGTATAANTTLIQIFGLGGNDELVWSRSVNLPSARIDGGAGNDTITSGTFNDTLVGGAGNDFFRLDTDTAAGSDTIDESGGGIDTLDFSSTTTRAVTIDLSSTAAQVVNAGLTLTLLAGNTIENVTGGALNDSLVGNSVDNVIVGSGGNDLLTGLGGNDRFIWDPGDGNDTLDGITGDGVIGSDRLVVNGSDDAEKFNISADGNGAQVTRDIDNVLLDLVGVETIDVNANGGADTITVGDLAATPITAVNLDVCPAGDGAADVVIVNGTAGNDSIELLIVPLKVIDLHAAVTLINLAANDSLTINGGGGDDNIAAANVLAGSFKLTENGEAGNDTLTGSRGNDTLVGGDGDDEFLGFRGNDLAFMGAGNDTFEWDQGDGSDTVEGQAGRDTMIFNGSNDAENFDVSANGNRGRFLRTVANAADVTMDLNSVEQVDLNARAGADMIVVNDLSATDVTALNLDLDSAAGTGFGDNASDSVVVNGTTGDDGIQIASFGLRIAFGGLFPFVNITGEDGLDALTVNTLGGNDIVDAANLAATNASELIHLTENGGAGSDTLIGSQGFDTFVWNPGDGNDTIEGGDGQDTLIFDGSDLSEKFDISANGDRVRLTRNVGGVTMDLGTVDAITVNALGGADTTTVNDLTGTTVTEINLNLAGAVGGTAADDQDDSVIFNGTNGADSIPVIGGSGVILVNDGGSLPYAMAIRAVEATDVLRINGNGANDTIDADLDTPVKLSVDGGAQTDTVNVMGTAPGAAATVLPSTGDDTVNVNADGVGVANVVFNTTQRIGQLNINTRGVATLTSGGAKVLTTAGLVIAGSGRLDLSDNNFILDYSTPASPISGIRSLLASGFNGGAWNGPGIISSVAAARRETGIGFAEATDLFTAFPATFKGQSIDNTSVLLTHTLNGDADLNGTVNLQDFNRLSSSFGTSGKRWSQGDFDYNGTVDLSDFNRFAANFGRTATTLAPKTSVGDDDLLSA